MLPFLTALEHQPIPVSRDGGGWSLTPAEAERLARVGEQRPGFCEFGVGRVKLAQYCGVVSLGRRVLEILPKTEDHPVTADDCRGVLLRLLALTRGVPAWQHPAAAQHLRRAHLLEAFIAAFFESVGRLVRGGLLKQYQEHEEDLRLVRGRIVVQRQLGSLFDRPDLVACGFDELTIDNPWNRLLKKAMRCTRPWIRQATLQRQWVELMSALDDVDDARLLPGESARLAFNRQAERYRPAAGWARSILDLLSPDLRAGGHEAPALLFDMNKLFESAVTALARRAAAACPGLDVEAQDRSAALAWREGNGSQEPVFPLRPDLVFRCRSQVRAVADAKWKRLAHDRRGRPMPEEADMYQMHAYAAAFRCASLALVYPWHRGVAGVQPGGFRLPAIEGLSPLVHVLCVDLEDDRFPLRLGEWPLSG